MGRHKKSGRKRIPKKLKEQHKKEWRAKNTKIINVRFRVLEDKDVLEHLDKQSNKTDYIRKLILNDLNKDK